MSFEKVKELYLKLLAAEKPTISEKIDTMSHKDSLGQTNLQCEVLENKASAICGHDKTTQCVSKVETILEHKCSEGKAKNVEFIAQNKTKCSISDTLLLENLSQNLEKFISEINIKTVNKLKDIPLKTILEKSLDKAQKFYLKISSSENTTKSENVVKIYEQDILERANLARELQEALSVVKCDNLESKASMLTAVEKEMLEHIAEFITQIQPDLAKVSAEAVSVLHQNECEEISEQRIQERLSQNLEQFISEEIVQTVNELKDIPMKAMLQESLNKAQELHLKISSTANTATSENVVEISEQDILERANLARELQDALSVVKCDFLESKASTLPTVEKEMLKHIAEIITQIQPDLAKVSAEAVSVLHQNECEKISEQRIQERLSQNLEQFISEEIVQTVNELKDIPMKAMLQESLDKAQELHLKISSTANTATSENVVEISEQDISERANLARQLQEALSVVKCDFLEIEASTLPTVEKEMLKHIAEIITQIQPDLAKVSAEAVSVLHQNECEEISEQRIQERLSQNLEQFISVEIVQTVNELKDIPMKAMLQESLDKAQELHLKISSTANTASSENVVEISEQDISELANLARELQEALSVVQCDVLGSEATTLPTVEKEMLKHIAEIITQIQPDLAKVSAEAVSVLHKNECEEISEQPVQESLSQNLEQFISEEIVQTVNELKDIPMKAMLQESLDKAQELHLKISSTANTATSENVVEISEQDILERANLARELQEALSVVLCDVLESEASTLPTEEKEMLKHIAEIITQIQPDLAKVSAEAVSVLHQNECGEISEQPVQEWLSQNLEQFISEDKVKTVNELKDIPMKAMLQESLNKAQELHLKISSTANTATSENVVEISEQDILERANLTRKLQEVLSVVKCDFLEIEASTLPTVEKEMLKHIAEIITQIQPDLAKVSAEAVSVLHQNECEEISEQRIQERLSQNLEQFISVEIVQTVNELKDIPMKAMLQESLDKAQELHLKISSTANTASSENVVEISEQDISELANLARELQEALSVVQCDVLGSEATTLPTVEKEMLKHIAEIITQIQPDLAKVSAEAVSVLHKNECEEISEQPVQESLSQNLEQFISKEIVQTVNELKDIPMKAMLQESLDKAQELHLKISSTANTATSENVVEISEQDILERANLARELQEALSVVQCDVLGSEATTLPTVEKEMMKHIAEIITQIQPDLAKVSAEAVAVLHKNECEEISEQPVQESLSQKLEQFISEEIVQTVNELKDIPMKAMLQESLDKAQKLHLKISSTANTATSDNVVEISEQDILERANLARELQEALSVVQCDVLESKAPTLLTVKKEMLKHIAEIITQIQPDLAKVSAEAVSVLHKNECEEISEQRIQERLSQNLEQFISVEIVQTVNELKDIPMKAMLQESLDKAQEMHLKISSTANTASSENVVEISEQEISELANLARELQEALSVVQCDVLGSEATTLPTVEKEMLKHIAEIITQIQPDLAKVSAEAVSVLHQNECEEISEQRIQERLSQNLEQFISVEIVQTVNELKDILMKAMLQESLDKAQELHLKISSTANTASSENVVEISEQDISELANLARELQEALSVVQCDVLGSEATTLPTVEKEMLKHIAEIITQIQPDLAKVSAEAVSVLHKNECEEISEQPVQESLSQNLEQFISEEIVQTVNELKDIPMKAMLQESLDKAQELHLKISSTANTATSENVVEISEQDILERANLARELQEALSVVQCDVLENEASTLPTVEKEMLKHIAEIITQIQPDLAKVSAEAVSVLHQNECGEISEQPVQEWLSQNLEQFISEDKVKTVNELKDIPMKAMLQESLNKAQELHLKISSTANTATSENVVEISEQDILERANLARELHEALSIVQCDVLGSEATTLPTVEKEMLKHIAEIITQIQPDLAKVSAEAVSVLHQNECEEISEQPVQESLSQNLKQFISEEIVQTVNELKDIPMKAMLQESLDKAQKLHLKISSTANTATSENVVEISEQDILERANLARELHEALSIVQCDVLGSEATTLPTVEKEMLKHIAEIITQIQPDLAKVSAEAVSVLHQNECEEISEQPIQEKLSQNLEQFISEEIVQTVNELKDIPMKAMLQESLDKAQELHLKISSTANTATSENVVEISEQDILKRANLARELQEALSVVQCDVLGSEATTLPTVEKEMFKHIAEIITQIQPDLAKVSAEAVSVLHKNECEEISEKPVQESLSQNLKQFISEEIVQTVNELKDIPMKAMLQESLDKAQKLHLKISSTANTATSENLVEISEQDILERANLARELQEALSVVQCDVLESEASTLPTVEKEMLKHIAEIITKIQPDLAKVSAEAVSVLHQNECEEISEQPVQERLSQNLEQFISEDIVRTVNEIKDISMKAMLQESLNKAQELHLKISSTANTATSENVVEISEQDILERANLTRELQEALSVVKCDFLESEASELPTLEKEMLMHIVEIITQIQPDLAKVSAEALSVLHQNECEEISEQPVQERLSQNLEQFISEDIVKTVNELKDIPMKAMLQESLNKAQELHLKISSTANTATSENVVEFSEQDILERANLARELQEALSVVQCDVLESEASTLPTVEKEMLKHIAEIITQIQPDLAKVSVEAVSVLHQNECEEISEKPVQESLSKNLEQFISEDIVKTVNELKDIPMKAMLQESLNKAQELHLKILSIANTATSENVVEISEQDILERANLARELQEALSVVQCDVLESEATTLPTEEKEMLKHIAEIVTQIQPDLAKVSAEVVSVLHQNECEEISEQPVQESLSQNLEQFISEEIVQTVNELKDIPMKAMLQESLDKAQELHLKISSTANTATSENLVEISEQDISERANLARELQEALSVVQCDVLESEATTLLTVEKEMLKHIAKIITQIQPDLAKVSAEAVSLLHQNECEEISEQPVYENLSQNLEKFISEDIVKTVNELKDIPMKAMLQESLNKAQELHLKISSTANTATSENVVEISEQDILKRANLDRELQEALSVFLCDVLESEASTLPTVEKEMLKHIAEIITQIQPDLAKVSAEALSVLHQNECEEISEQPIQERLSQNLEQFISEDIVKTVNELKDIPMKAMLQESLDKAQELHLKISSTANTATSENVVEISEQDILERANLAQELQEALSVVQCDVLESEASTLPTAEKEMLKHIAEIITQIQPDLAKVSAEAVSILHQNECEEISEQPVQERLSQNLEQFISEEIVQTVNELKDIPMKAMLQESLDKAQELHLKISSTANTATSENVVEISEQDILERANLARQLQEALSVVQCDVLESEASTLTTVEKEMLKHIAEIITQIQPDLAKVSAKAVSVLHQNECEEISEQLVNENLSQNLEQFISEDIVKTVNELKDIPMKAMLQESLNKAQELHLKISSTANTATSENVVEISEQDILKRANLARELQEALSVVQCDVLEIEATTLPTVEKEMPKHIAEFITQIQPDLVKVSAEAVSVLHQNECEEISEQPIQERLSQNLEQFISEDIVQTVNELKDIPMKAMLQESLDKAQELHLKISSTANTATSENVVEISEQDILERANLARELQEALSVVQCDVLESEASTLPTVEKEMLKHIAEIITQIQPDLSVVTPESVSVLDELERVEILEQPVTGSLFQNLERFISEDVVQTVKDLKDIPMKAMLQESLDKAVELYLKCASSENIATSKNIVGISEQHSFRRANLARELQETLFVVKCDFLESEVSTLPVVEQEKLKHVADLITQIQHDLSILTPEAVSVLNRKECVEISEQPVPEILSKNIEEFISEDIVHTGKELKDIPIKAMLQDTLDKAVEMYSKIASSENSTTSKNEVEISEQDSLEQVNLARELREAFSVVQYDVHEGEASTLPTVELEKLTHVAEITTQTQHDLSIVTPEALTVLNKNERVNILETPVIERLFMHLEQFISDEISQTVKELKGFPMAEMLITCLEKATDLHLNIGSGENLQVFENVDVVSQNNISEQAKLTHELQEALSAVHCDVLESTVSTLPAKDSEKLKKVAEVINLLQHDFIEPKPIAVSVVVHDRPEFSIDISDGMSTITQDRNSLDYLEKILKENLSKLNFMQSLNTNDTNDFYNTLDEIQTILIKLKYDYNCLNDEIVDENLEDLECNVRSVQLQLSDKIQPSVFKEAFTSLLLTVKNIKQYQNIKQCEKINNQKSSKDLLKLCIKENENTLKVLDLTTQINDKEEKALSEIIKSLQDIKSKISVLKKYLSKGVDEVIDKGVEIKDTLTYMQKKVQELETKLQKINFGDSKTKDTIIKAIHSVINCTSNMQSVLLTIQKQSLYEWYGKPTENILYSIKTIKNILETANLMEIECGSWKHFSCFLRKLLNHFEDIKFYINFDKAARLPIQSKSYTNVLNDLQNAYNDIKNNHSSNTKVYLKIIKINEFINNCLDNCEKQSTIEVKDKIYVYKNLARDIQEVTDVLKSELELSTEMQNEKESVNVNKHEELTLSTLDKELQLNTKEKPEEIEHLGDKLSGQEEKKECQDHKGKELKNLDDGIKNIELQTSNNLCLEKDKVSSYYKETDIEILETNNVEQFSPNTDLLMDGQFKDERPFDIENINVILIVKNKMEINQEDGEIIALSHVDPKRSEISVIEETKQFGKGSLQKSKFVDDISTAEEKEEISHLLQEKTKLLKKKNDNVDQNELKITETEKSNATNKNSTEEEFNEEKSFLVQNKQTMCSKEIQNENQPLEQDILDKNFIKTKETQDNELLLQRKIDQSDEENNVVSLSEKEKNITQVNELLQEEFSKHNIEKTQLLEKEKGNEILTEETNCSLDSKQPNELQQIVIDQTETLTQNLIQDKDFGELCKVAKNSIEVSPEKQEVIKENEFTEELKKEKGIETKLLQKEKRSKKKSIIKENEGTLLTPQKENKVLNQKKINEHEEPISEKVDKEITEPIEKNCITEETKKNLEIPMSQSSEPQFDKNMKLKSAEALDSNQEEMERADDKALQSFIEKDQDLHQNVLQVQPLKETEYIDREGKHMSDIKSETFKVDISHVNQNNESDKVGKEKQDHLNENKLEDIKSDHTKEKIQLSEQYLLAKNEPLSILAQDEKNVINTDIEKHNAMKVEVQKEFRTKGLKSEDHFHEEELQEIHANETLQKKKELDNSVKGKQIGSMKQKGTKNYRQETQLISPKLQEYNITQENKPVLENEKQSDQIGQMQVGPGKLTPASENLTENKTLENTNFYDIEICTQQKNYETLISETNNKEVKKHEEQMYDRKDKKLLQQDGERKRFGKNNDNSKKYIVLDKVMKREQEPSLETTNSDIHDLTMNENYNLCSLGENRHHQELNSRLYTGTCFDEFPRPPSYHRRNETNEIENYYDHMFNKNCNTSRIYKAQAFTKKSQLNKSSFDYNRRSEPLQEPHIVETKYKTKATSEARSLYSTDGRTVRDAKRKPVFSTFLTDRSAVEGSRVKLTCSVLSNSDPTIKWYKNGLSLNDKSKYKTKCVGGLITLEVLNAVPDDSAEYCCVVENDNGQVSSTAHLKVYPSFEAFPIPPTFTRSIKDTYHLAENELVLECRIRGQPLPSITWLKDNIVLKQDEQYSMFYLADGVCRLTISSPTSDDNGTYTCKAANSVWSDHISHAVYFTGRERQLSPNIATIEKTRFYSKNLDSRRPHFTNVLSDHSVVTGGTMGLQVEIRGSPTKVEWLKEGHSVLETHKNARAFVENNLYTLTLADISQQDSGLYTCRAWSNHGKVDMNASINVIRPTDLKDGKPAEIVGRPRRDIFITIGEDINISFRVHGEPKPKVVLMKGARDITNSQRVCKMTSDDYVKFTLKRSVIADAGTYCVLARNIYGCDRAFVTVAINQRASSENLISDWTYPMDDFAISMPNRSYKSVPGKIPGELNMVDSGNNWISLTWSKPESQGSAPVAAYKIESWQLGAEGGARWTELGITPINIYDVFNLKQGEEYHFRVTPRNRYGWGEPLQTNNPVGIGQAGARPEFVEILSGQLKVLVGETANLNCRVKGQPIPDVVWMKNGHELESENDRIVIKYDGFNCKLTIQNVNIEDEGRYSCEASNVHGRASTYARIAVVTDRLIYEADARLKRERSADIHGDHPPQFTMRLRDRRVQTTYPVRLTCQVIGEPSPIVTWFKNGEEVRSDERHTMSRDEHFHTLEVAPTTLEDGGTYEAMARNSLGAVSCRCSLIVDKGIRAYIAPEFCCGLESLYKLTEGEELRISAMVEAYPSVGITWYRDGVRLRPSRRVIMTLDRDGGVELAIAAITLRDAGVYTCTASNEVGRSSTSGKVDVVEGDDLVEQDYKSPPTLLAPDIPYSKEPMFIRKPRSSEAHEGDTVIIQCEVVGDPKPDVYWLRDFLKPDYYRDATHFKRVGDGPEYRFEIPHAKLDYTGAYSVVARNIHGEAKAVISLQILAKGPETSTETHNIRYSRSDVIPIFSRELTDLLCCDGDAIEFECEVTGNPEPEVKWYRYRELIRENPDFTTSFDGNTARLKIKQVTAEDEGIYVCEAINDLGKTTTTAALVVYPPGEPNTLSQQLRRPPALLSAQSTPRSTPRATPARSLSQTPGPESRRYYSPSRQVAPKFYTYPHNKIVEEGAYVIFQCAVTGHPTPWATWDKDGIMVTPSSRISIKEREDIKQIEIEDVTVEDAGLYRIVLENDFGRVEATARLDVISHRGKVHGGVRAYSASPRRSINYRRNFGGIYKRDDASLYAFDFSSPLYKSKKYTENFNAASTIAFEQDREVSPSYDIGEFELSNNSKQQNIKIKVSSIKKQDKCTEYFNPKQEYNLGNLQSNFLDKLIQYENHEEKTMNTHIRLLKNELINILNTNPTSNEINELTWRLLSFMPKEQFVHNKLNMGSSESGARWQSLSTERNMA